MNLTQISSTDLKRITRLLEQKETLLAEVAEIDGELTKFETGEPVSRGPGKRGQQARAKRAGRGALKAAIIELVQRAGRAGITVKDVAASLGVKPGNISVWFNATGKKVKEIRKAGPGKYVWASSSTIAQSKGVAKAKPEKPPARQPQAKKEGKLKDMVIGLVRNSGRSGISVQEIAGTLGINTHRVFSWFHSTGKKVKAIKKAGRAKYAWVG